MSWARLDDALLDHRKIFEAGSILGSNGAVIALGLYAVGLLWANKHLSDGRLPLEVVRSFRHARQPIKVADALVAAGLWERTLTGFQIHDFHDYNDTAKNIRTRRLDRHRQRLRAVGNA